MAGMKATGKGIFRKRDRQKGATLLEGALVFPLMMMFIIGIFWFGRAYNVYQTITRAAREGARAATAPSCAKCTPANTYPTALEVQTIVGDALRASNLDPTNAISSGKALPTACTGGGSAACSSGIEVCTNMLLNEDPANPGNPTSGSTPICGTTVRFRYPFRFALPFSGVGFTTINIATEVRMREER